MTEPLVDIGSYRENLADKLASLAAWRNKEALGDPDAEPGTPTAQALRTAASDVLAMSHDDPRLRELATVCQAHNDRERISYIEAEDHIVGRHGSGDGATSSTDELLAALAVAAKDAAGRA